MPQAASMEKASPMTQMNTRIERELKQRGDAVLARAGFSPSEAVRALWEFAAAHEREPQAVARALAVEDPEAERERQERIQRKRDSLKRLHATIAEFSRALRHNPRCHRRRQPHVRQGTLRAGARRAIRGKGVAVSAAPKLLVDTNVWLDGLLPRRPGHEAARKFFDFAGQREVPLLYAATTAKDVFFLAETHAETRGTRAGTRSSPKTFAKPPSTLPGAASRKLPRWDFP